MNHIAINAFFWARPDTGSGQYIKNLVHHLANLEPSMRITLVYPGSKTPNDSLPASCSWHLVTPRPGHIGKLLFEQFDFPRACRQIGADLAHIPYWGPPLRSPAPVVVTIHDLIPLLLCEYRGGILARLYTSFVAASARGARQIITDSNASKKDICSHLGIPDSKIHVIYLAASDKFKPGPADPQVVDRYHLPDAYTLYMGGYDVRKNVPALLQAYTIAGPSIGDQFPLVLAGRIPAIPSPRFPDIHKLIAELEIQDFVALPGFIDEADKPALYRNATSVIFMSKYEGFGLPVLEAMACGIPVVVSDCSSLPEIVGPAGFVLDPDDIKGLAGAIIACSIQDDLRANLRQRGLEQAGRFTWTKTAQQTLQVYRQVIA
ncbi:MAG: glycosyltransferase family 4 protein [Anaerolineales bacterium]|nr:glycosyltransferase family 4 protein [Anaerolineales bacterium]